MKARGWWAAVLLVMMVLGVSMSASAIQLQFVGVTGGPSPIGPYGMRISGDLPVGGPIPLGALPNTPANATIDMVCNDYSGHAPDPVTNPWEVQKHALTNASLAVGVGDGVPADTKAKFYVAGGGGVYVAGFLQAEEVDYRAGAWLAARVLNNVQRTASQQALWNLFNNNAFENATSNGLITQAYEAVDGDGIDEWSGWQSYAVYTRVPLNGPPGGTQEFYANVPEASSFAVLGLNVGAFGLLGFVFRRRMNKLS